MAGFEATGAGGAKLLLDDTETALVRQLTAELRAMLSGRALRGDPVYERLFPSTFEDPEEEASYRELIGDDLLSHKLEALDKVSTSLGPRTTEVTIEGDELDAWLACLTDLRLAIGTKLSVDEERMAADVDPSDPLAHALAVLHWLGWVQEGVLRACAEL